MRILLVYGTAKGQTRKVVEFLAEQLRARAQTVEVCDAGRLPRRFDPAGFDRIVVASCVRQGEYRRSISRFARRYRDVLQAVPSVFLSVSLAAANVLHRADAKRWLDGWDSAFSEQTGWKPARIVHVGGRLAYSRYNLITRWIMQRIAQDQGYDTDMVRDYEYTDWRALEKFADSLVTPQGAIAA